MGGESSSDDEERTIRNNDDLEEENGVDNVVEHEEHFGVSDPIVERFIEEEKDETSIKEGKKDDELFIKQKSIKKDKDEEVFTERPIKEAKDEEIFKEISIKEEKERLIRERSIKKDEEDRFMKEEEEERKVNVKSHEEVQDRDLEEPLLTPDRTFTLNWKQLNERARKLKYAIRTLQLDPSQKSCGVLSWFIGFLMIFVVPILRLVYVRAADNNPQHALVFQPFVVIVGILISAVSFGFLRRAVWKYDLQGMLNLDNATEEVIHRCEGYQKVIQGGSLKLTKMILPLLLVYIVQRCWFYIVIPVAPLPYLNNEIANIVVISLAEGISWIFQTTIFIYACILFWKVCLVQELKMKVFKDMLFIENDPQLFFEMYTAIVKSLHVTSRQFRFFLALTGFITIVSALSSLYEITIHRQGIRPLLSGELVILNLVNITGIGLCLKSASKLAHLHRRIVKAASSMHAKVSLARPTIYSDQKHTEFESKMLNYHQAQDLWTQRNALVNFLANNMVGISVYGFVLDRFLVHSSIAILLMTTWFILGRSL